jgi:hypothetical protein
VITIAFVILFFGGITALFNARTFGGCIAGALAMIAGIALATAYY